MADYYYKQVNVRFGPQGISPMVRNLLIANVAVYLVQVFARQIAGFGAVEGLFMLTPSEVFKGYIWQIFTYMFLHAAPMHLIMNMLFLWMFGVDVERAIGTKQFTFLYFVSGIGSGILTCFFPPFWNANVLGASGALFGVMVAFGLIFPDRIILLFFIIPIRAIYMVFFMIAFETLYLVSSLGASGTAHITHVAGALFGWLFIKYAKRIPSPKQKVIEFKKQRDEINEAEEQKRVDEILDKINHDGMHTLSRTEREFLRRRAQRRK